MGMHLSSARPRRALAVAARVVVASAALLAACGGADASLAVTEVPTGTATSVTVARVATGLRLTNTGSAPLAFAIMERTYAALADIAACADPGPACVRLPAGQTVSVPFTEISGYAAGAREVIVYTWRVVPNGTGGYRAADFGSLVVRL
jgi:hypothetical protein